MPRRRIRYYVATLVCLSCALAAAAEESTQATDSSASKPDDSKTLLHYWPNFRGPYALGRAVDADPPPTFNATEGANIGWKIELPKRGMSSPIAWKDRIFLTGADEQSRQVYCIDGNSGHLLWQHDVRGVPGSPDDGRIPKVLDEAGYAAPTPVTDGKHVAAIFATGELVCVTNDGQRHWIKHLGVPQNHYGHTTSLLAYQHLLFVQYDQQEKSQLLAFDFATGELAWHVDRNDMSWSSPLLADVDGRPQLILTNRRTVAGYDVKTGTQRWSRECLDGEVASSAAYAKGIVFVASEGASGTAIDIRGHEPQVLWQWDKALPDASSPVADDKYVIVPTAFGVVSCLDLQTGQLLWEHEFNQGFSSSPVLVNDRIYLTDLSGTTQIFKMDATFALLGTAEVGEPVYATPAFVGNRIYLRGLDHLFCIRAKTDY